MGEILEGHTVTEWDIPVMPFRRWTSDQRCYFQIFVLTHSVNPAQLL